MTGGDAGERAYAELLRDCRERALLGSCATLLEWDEDTIMPAGGVEHRSRQRALLAGLEHERWLDPRLGELLSIVEASALVEEQGSPAAVNVRELRRLEKRNTKLDRKHVEELARTCAIAEHHYALAQQHNDFDLFAPWLDKVLALKRHEARILSPDSPYDALLDEYEPGMRTAELEPLFTALKNDLQPLLDTIENEELSIARSVPVEKQRRLLEEATRRIGFDYTRGRLDESQHPFTSMIGPGDIRITTRFLPHDFSEGFFCGLHELGHGLYDQALTAEHFGTPYGDATSLAMHEGQARLWENVVGRRRAFWEYFFPRLQKEFTPVFDDLTLDQFVRGANKTQRSLRRVRADQITYNLHIIIRVELELALIRGDLETKHLREAWNASYERELGLVPRDDREGLLQDGHWSAGMFGYFSTYTLGNMIAAQLFAAAQKQAGDLDAAFARGDFSTLLRWLNTHVHAKGGALSSRALVHAATGEPLGHRALIDSLREKTGR